MKKIILLVVFVIFSAISVDAQAYRSFRIAESPSRNVELDDPREGDIDIIFSRVETYGGAYRIYVRLFPNGNIAASLNRDGDWVYGRYTLQDAGRAGTADVTNVFIRWNSGKQENAKIYYYSNKTELSYKRLRWSTYGE